ncbi:MAG: NAD(P)/FAD-dependent oxidoreductase [Subtercola sp.]|nr:NAD(P)/FAD-dependent oxidoreductase [Subtercola sp.]
MSQVLTAESTTQQQTTEVFDALVIGAGTSGLYELYLLTQQGLNVRGIEAGSSVGGTWYWNRYPGCRLDSESFTYQYAFPDDVLATWNWKELFAGQPELESYFNEVADHYNLRANIDFNTRVASMTFDEQNNQWTVTAESGKTYIARVVVSATGLLSAPIYPQISGMETFTGESYHTGLWPDKEVTFSGKKVIVIGTGASGVQVITEIAKDVSHLTVFQRTPNWVIPLRNRPLTDDDMQRIRAGYPEMFPKLRNTWSGFLHSWDPKPTTDYTDEELRERFETAYNSPGFAKWFGLPNDIAFDDVANQKWCDFMAEKIHEIVPDPELSRLLIPNHPFGAKRVPCGTHYFELYNQDNVELLSLAEHPILEVTSTGVRTPDGDIEADMIVYATGFEAFVGALNRMDITGLGGAKLRDKWEDGPKTFLGLQVAGFPNLFLIGGPHGKGGHGNSPRCAEGSLEWMALLVGKLARNELTRVEATPEAEAEWTETVNASGMGGFMAKTKNAFFGDNVPGRKRAFLAYTGALPEFDERLRTMAQSGYPGLQITA